MDETLRGGNSTYNVEGTKGHFPYEFVTSVSKLNEPLPAREHFYSDLKEKHLSEEAYQTVVNVYKAKGMSSLKLNKQKTTPNHESVCHTNSHNI